jgi:hypothetical protein
MSANPYEAARERLEQADENLCAALFEADRIMREADEARQSAEADLCRYESSPGIPLPQYRKQVTDMSAPGPITVTAIAAIVRLALNSRLEGIADAPEGGAFELTTAATGQRFRVAVTEVPAWSDRMDRELSELTGTEAAS